MVRQYSSGTHSGSVSWKAAVVCSFALASIIVGGPAKGSSQPVFKHRPWRGVFFNPQVEKDPNFPWLLTYSRFRERIRTELKQLAKEAGINLVDVFIMIPNSLKKPAQGNRVGESLADWANLDFLNHVASFVDDCREAGVDVELDLVDNRWIPYSVDSQNHIGKLGNPWWPVADDAPWKASAAWYSQIIEYVESHAKHPEAIAMWSMTGNYTWGAAEPVLWEDDGRPELKLWTERFVKGVWPTFRSAGHRPKASPILLPIFSNNSYWMPKPPMARLGAFTNLKKWLVDDLKLPPDYWVMSTYPFCDPAPDGFSYLREIVNIIGKKNASRILSTDLKGIGHESELSDSIIMGNGKTGAQILRWHIDKCAQYKWAGWWMWAYQDTPDSKSGLRTLDGQWKQDLLNVISGNRR